jgi:hypothetical protein
MLRAEVKVCLFIWYRRYRFNEVAEWHSGDKGIEPGKTVRHSGSNLKIGVLVYLTTNLVAIARYEPIPGIPNKRKRKESGKHRSRPA